MGFFIYYYIYFFKLYYFRLLIFPFSFSLFIDISVSTWSILTPIYSIIVLGRLIDLCYGGLIEGGDGGGRQRESP